MPNSTQIQAKLYPTFITQQLQEIETWFKNKNNSQAKIGKENKLKIALKNQLSTTIWLMFVLWSWTRKLVILKDIFAHCRVFFRSASSGRIFLYDDRNLHTKKLSSTTTLTKPGSNWAYEAGLLVLIYYLNVRPLNTFISFSTHSQ